MTDTSVVSVPQQVATRKTSASKPARKSRRQPPYQVILWNDDDHTYAYVIEMLGKLFGLPFEQAFLLAEEVDTTGKAVVETTTKERAEFKRDQIHAYGADWRLARCKGSMTASIEPAPDAG